MSINSDHRLIFLGSRKGLFPDGLSPRVVVCHDRSEVDVAVKETTKAATWISFNQTLTDILLKNVVDKRANLHGSHLLTLMPPRSESIPALLGLFHPVFGLGDGFQWLPKAELVEAIISDEASDRMIGGGVDPRSKTLTLLRGDVTALVVPFSEFADSGDGITPDFTRLSLIDHGRTVALGEYEASADAILYERDPRYRRRLDKQRRRSDRSFGASLTRLRKQRGLKRTDFAPISSKEIARLERDEILTPHPKTLETLARQLQVRPEEIGNY